jgi:hypothetical protein
MASIFMVPAPDIGYRNFMPGSPSDPNRAAQPSPTPPPAPPSTPAQSPKGQPAKPPPAQFSFASATATLLSPHFFNQGAGGDKVDAGYKRARDGLTGFSSGILAELERRRQTAAELERRRRAAQVAPVPAPSPEEPVQRVLTPAHATASASSWQKAFSLLLPPLNASAGGRPFGRFHEWMPDGNSEIDKGGATWGEPEREQPASKPVIPPPPLAGNPAPDPEDLHDLILFPRVAQPLPSWLQPPTFFQPSDALIKEAAATGLSANLVWRAGVEGAKKGGKIALYTLGTQLVLGGVVGLVAANIAAPEVMVPLELAVL